MGGTSSIWALMSIILPRPLKGSLSSARQLLVINVACNSLLHAFLWAAMIGACSECSLRLSLSSLSAAWPALLVLGIISILAAFPYYYFTIKPSRPATPPPKTGTCGDLLLHTVSNTGVHGGASGHDSVGVQILTDVNI